MKFLCFFTHDCSQCFSSAVKQTYVGIQCARARPSSRSATKRVLKTKHILCGSREFTTWSLWHRKNWQLRYSWFKKERRMKRVQLKSNCVSQYTKQPQLSRQVHARLAAQQRTFQTNSKFQKLRMYPSMSDHNLKIPKMTNRKHRSLQITSVHILFSSTLHLLWAFCTCSAQAPPQFVFWTITAWPSG